MNEPEEIFARAMDAQRAGRLDAAREDYMTVLRANPRHVDALLQLGRIAVVKKELDFGIMLMKQAVGFAPQFAEGYFHLGEAYAQKRKWEAAVTAYRAALAADPQHAEACNNLGSALMAQEKTAEAIGAFRGAIAVKPDCALAYANLGGALKKFGQYAEAAEACRGALALQLDLPEAWNNLGGALTAIGEIEASLAVYREAVRLRPEYFEAHTNLGYSLQLQGDLEAAFACYAEALRLAPDYADAHFSEALGQLLAGNLPVGFRKYEARWDTAQRGQRREFAAPLWLGELPLGGTTILLHAEQGLGDTLQFVRYAPVLAARGARVLLEVQAPLKGIVATLPAVAEIFGRGEPLPEFDFHCPLLSLGFACGTELASIPASGPYLRAPEEKRKRWLRAWADTSELKVGVVWAGNRNHRNDHNRSVPLEVFAPLLATPGCRFFGLQKELTAADSARLRDEAGFTDLSREMGDFGDTAAILGALDLVITVDTSAAHLAGALGATVWVLLPFAPDWRWLLERVDSPWYPTARLWRQTRAKDWTGVIARVGDELQRRVAARAT